MMAIFALIWAGLSLTEQVSIHLLPDTIEQFTKKAFIISLVLFLNPAFGFIAQPLVGILSDKIWTPVGRRAFFLISCAPFVGICLWLIPEARFLWHIVVLVFIYQFFQDILWGSDHPLVADLFPPKQRLLVVSLLLVTGQLATWIFLEYGMTLFEAGELYKIIAVVQVVLVSGLAFFLNEKPVKKSQRPKLTIKRYVLDIWTHPALRKFAILNFTLAMVLNLAANGGLLRLFATNQLGASQGDYGSSWSAASLAPLFLSIPMALIIEKFISKRWALSGGFAIMTAALLMGWFAQNITHFYWMALTWGFGYMLVQVTYKPFLTEYLPSDIIGQVSGAINICYGLGRSLAILIAGAAVDYLFDNNYRYIFPMGMVMAIVSIWVSLSIPDLRYQARKRGEMD